MTNELPLATYADVVVVEAEHVLGHARDGYRVLHVIEHAQKHMPATPTPRWEDGKQVHEPPCILTIPFFLMGKAEPAVIDELRASLLAAETRLANIGSTSEQLTTQVRGLMDDLRASQHDHENTTRDHEKTTRDLVLVAGRLRKLEDDLDKVRRHFGDKAFNEALAK